METAQIFELLFIAGLVLSGLGFLWLILKLLGLILDLIYKAFQIVFETMGFIGIGFRRFFLFIGGIVGVSLLAKRSGRRS